MTLRRPRPLPLPEIQRILDARTALLEFFVADEGSYLFVVTQGELTVHRLPPRAEIQPLVESFNAAAQSASTDTTSQSVFLIPAPFGLPRIDWPRSTKWAVTRRSSRL